MGYRIQKSLLLALAVSAVPAPAQDRFIGAWSLNLQKSEVRGGMQMTLERRGEALRYISGGVEFTALFDGHDFPIRGVSTHATVSLKRIDERTIERTYKRETVPVSSAVLRVSADDRFLTIENQRLANAGETRRWVNKYQRVSTRNPADPFEGTWERNPERSLGNSRSSINYEAFGADGLHFRGNNVEYQAEIDGKFYPVRGSIVADSVSLKRLAPGTIEETWKDGERIAVIVKRAVSADGATLTAHSTGTTPQGDRFENIYVYERQ